MYAPHHACLMSLAAECNTYAKRNFRVDFVHDGWSFTMAVPTIIVHKDEKTVATICPPVNQFLCFDDSWLRDSDILKALILFADKYATHVAAQGIPEFQQFVNKVTLQVRRDLHIAKGVPHEVRNRSVGDGGHVTR